MPKDKNKRTFVRVTNKDIFNELKDMKTEIYQIKEQVIQGNGTLNWHTKAIYTLFSAIGLIIGWVVIIRG